MWPSWRRETRTRAGDPDLWGALYDRFHPDPDDGFDRPRRGEIPLPADAKARLLDAALGIVGSVRTFFEVAEDVLLEQRDRLRPGPPNTEPSWPRVAESPRNTAPAAVEDIPMEET